MLRIFMIILGLAMLNGQAAMADQLWQLQNNKNANADGLSRTNNVGGFEKVSINLRSDAIFAMQAGESADIFLPDGKLVNARLEAIKGHSLGGKSWLGWAGEGVNRGRIVMTEVNGFTFAAITYGKKLYLIEPAHNAQGYILYPSTGGGITEPAFGQDGIIPPAGAILEKAPTNTDTLARPSAVGTIGTVDVGIFFHSSMRDLWGLGMSARLQFLVQLYDTAMTDSLTSVRANLVHISEVTGTQTKSNGDTLTDLKDGASNADGDFSGVAAIKAAKGIDIVTYIRRFKASTHVSCGTGFVLGTGGSNTIGVGSSPFGFNTVSDNKDIDAPSSGSFSLCSVFTLAHEIGHNMGTQHDLATSPADGVFSFSHGFRVDGDFRTIMGTSSGTGETRLGFFSNPDLAKCTDPGGGGGATTACGTAGSDAARSIREQGKNVGTFNAPAPRVVSSILPVSRSIKSDGTATAFGVVINPGGFGTATDCMLGIPGATPGQFSYQTATPANVLTGTPDTPVDIPAGAAQNFVFSITPGAPYLGFVPTFSFDTFTGLDLAIDFSCTNRQSAESIQGLNMLRFIAEAGDVMDVIALAATLGSDGIVNTGGATGVFSVAVSNIGVAGTVEVTGETSNASVTATVSVCETVPATGACMSPPAAMVMKTLAKDETATFGFFVAETAPIAADFAQKRIFAIFEQVGVVRGATSVAVRTGP